MTAKEIMTYTGSTAKSTTSATVEWDMPVTDVLPRLLDSSSHELKVIEDGNVIGLIDESSLLAGLGRFIAARDDCSFITVECSPTDYSASMLAHAVEDTDAHLVDLISTPSDNGMLRVSLRVRNSDPSSTVRSLERYGYDVVETHAASDMMQSVEIATERLLSLQTLMNV